MPFFQNNPAVSAQSFSLTLPFLKVNAELNVGELKQFLQLKLRLPEPLYNRIEFLFPNQSQVKPREAAEQWVILDESLTVIDVIDCLWNKSSELIFFYRISEEEEGAVDKQAAQGV